jgi:putative addiction module component (TIGR02574 family)
MVRANARTEPFCDSSFDWYTLGMSTTAEKLLEQALDLDEKDRARIAGALIESLETCVDPDAKEAWEAEISRRAEEIEAGTVELVPWSEVRKQLFSGFE